MLDFHSGSSSSECSHQWKSWWYTLKNWTICLSSHKYPQRSHSLYSWTQTHWKQWMKLFGWKTETGYPISLYQSSSASARPLRWRLGVWYGTCWSAARARSRWFHLREAKFTQYFVNENEVLPNGLLGDLAAEVFDYDNDSVEKLEYEGGRGVEPGGSDDV